MLFKDYLQTVKIDNNIATVPKQNGQSYWYILGENLLIKYKIKLYIKGKYQTVN